MGVTLIPTVPRIIIKATAHTTKEMALVIAPEMVSARCSICSSEVSRGLGIRPRIALGTVRFSTLSSMKAATNMMSTRTASVIKLAPL